MLVGAGVNIGAARSLANAIEPSMCGADADSLSSYFDHLFVN